MKRMRITDLPDNASGHFLSGVVPGDYLCMGGLSFKPPGFRTHDHDGPGGADLHVHDGCEVFLILQGRAVMEVDGESHPLQTGDVMIIEPGEDHHLIADEQDPCINVWLEAADHRHPDQEA